MINYLKRPSKILTNSQSRWILVGGVSSFIFIFLLVFRPFGMHQNCDASMLQVTMGYVLITLFFIALHAFAWEGFFVRLFQQKWTIGKHLFASLVSVTLIGISNGFYALAILNTAYLETHSTFQIFLEQIVYAHAVGLLPIVLVLLITELKNRNTFVLEPEVPSIPEEIMEEKKGLMELFGNSPNESLTIQRDQFRYARAAGNYLEIVYGENGTTAKVLFRMTLSTLIKQLTDSGCHVFQTHRSYVVNLDAIEDIYGNAQGYTLYLSDGRETIPVSRTRVDAFNELMKKNGRICPK